MKLPQEHFHASEGSGASLKVSHTLSMLRGLSLRSFQKSCHCRQFSVAPQNVTTATAFGDTLNLVPVAPSKVSRDKMEALTDFVSKKKHLIAITGAGLSTESGIPDYRSPNGSYSKGHKPTTYTEFVRSDSLRKRYWARNMAAWKEFSSHQPNVGHKVIASMEKEGRIKHLITQNVDRLHLRAGSQHVTELHGNTHEVACLSCGYKVDRPQFQNILKDANPDWNPIVTEEPLREPNPNINSPDKIRYYSDKSRQRADGDVDLGNVDYSKFNVPCCPNCREGIMKPCVVFFGESVPTEKVKYSMDMVSKVYSVYRFIHHAMHHDIPVAIVNIGPTRGDEAAALKIEGQVGPVLSELHDMLNKT
ncbi:hypothetical protein PROFUN_05475 [Planoprotostelium fungivorum]|uniref:Deacetylase sirtuin-type domain-containing protein n=1 Tax=Planoprotostelium fungivorum TaxID=1890364 RepID=A0A2P6NQW8_9EUKA|nr:hypothetical protein PROFUN_05475 [Planoprotostelium fungivorum]